MKEFDDYINDEISEEIYKERIDMLKRSMKKVAFHDKKDKVWTLRDWIIKTF